MSRLLLLTVVLVGSFVIFLVRGLPQAARAERAWAGLREREQELAATRRQVELVGRDEFLALSTRHVQAAAQAGKRWEAVTEGEAKPAAPALATWLEATKLAGLRRPSALADRLLAAGEASPDAATSLMAILQALPDADGLVVDDLALQDAGRPRAIHGLPRLQQVEAQLLVSGALPDLVAALERLAPERGSGAPILSVRAASFNRIEPERWGSGVRRLSTPPVRLSATVTVLLPTQAEPR